MTLTLHSYKASCESPSMGIICPEIERAISEARNRARAAMSLGSTNLFMDWFASASLVTSVTDLPLTLAKDFDVKQRTENIYERWRSENNKKFSDKHSFSLSCNSNIQDGSRIAIFNCPSYHKHGIGYSIYLSGFVNASAGDAYILRKKEILRRSPCK